jgi:hypothetical protein
MNPSGHVSLSRASRLIGRDYRTIERACHRLGVPLVSIGRFGRTHQFVPAAELDRLASHISGLPAVIDPRGFARHLRSGSEEEGLSDSDLRERVVAARRVKTRYGGLEVTDERLYAELTAMRQGVAS